MADSLAVLSGSTCGCDVECEISPKWFRFRFSWTSGTLHASIHHPHDATDADTKKAGYGLSTSCFNHLNQVYPTEAYDLYDSPSFTGTWYTNYGCKDFNACKYSTTTYNIPGDYLRATTSTTDVKLDMNIGLFKKNNPTATDVTVKIVPGTWAESATNNLISTWIDAADCYAFEGMVNSMNANWCGRWAYLIWYPETESWPHACAGYYNGYYYGYTLGPAGAKGRAITWYGYKKKIEYGTLNGKTTGVTIYRESATYDRDPDLAGAQQFYYVDRGLFDTAYVPTQWNEVKYNINLTTGKYVYVP